MRLTQSKSATAPWMVLHRLCRLGIFNTEFWPCPVSLSHNICVCGVTVCDGVCVCTSIGAQAVCMGRCQKGIRDV